MNSLRHVGLHGRMALYGLCLLSLIGLLIWAERAGARRELISVLMLGFTFVVYAVIGTSSRTADPLQYYAAGRSVPAVYNGMATAADWMSAASFISLMGVFYATGYSATMLLLGWTGGFCLVALLVAPYLRQLGELTLPDFLARRYGGKAVRLLAIVSVLCCSFIYVVAQIYAIGLISSRIFGVDFVLGIALALGGVMMCSFLGGMRAITWTQVTQYILMLAAVVIPLTWLSVKQTGSPWAHLQYSAQLHQLAIKEQNLTHDAAEAAVIDAYYSSLVELDEKLKDPSHAISQDRLTLQQQIAQLNAQKASASQLQSLEKQRKFLSGDPDRIIAKWRHQRQELMRRIEASKRSNMALSPVSQVADKSVTLAQKQQDQLNFLALVLVLSLGTASMPHLLMRFQTTRSVAQTRSSVSWALFFILLLYLCLPVIAVMLKLDVLDHLVGIDIKDAPAWLSQWSRLAPDLVSLTDANGDGKIQWNELLLSSDVLMLAMPEISSLPYTITVLVAAGALAAALSTADGLLLSITAVLAYDLRVWRSKQVAGQDHHLRDSKSLISSKLTLLVVTLLAAYVAAQKPAGIVAMVTLAFSLAASTFFVPIVFGIFWHRANAWGALAAMLSGAIVTLYCLIAAPAREVASSWLTLQAQASGIWGVLASAVAMLVFTLLTAKSERRQSDAISVLRQ